MSEPNSILMDLLIVTLRVPAGLPDGEIAAARQALASPAYLARLRRVVKAAVRGVPELAAVEVKVSR